MNTQELLLHLESQNSISVLPALLLDQPPSKLGERERELEFRNLGVSEIAMEQKRELPQNKTNIHLLLFNSPVQPPPKLGKRERAQTGNLGVREIAMELKRRLPQNKTNIHLLSFNSPVQPPSKLGKRERAQTLKLSSQ